MIKTVFLSILIFIFFGACKKDLEIGDKDYKTLGSSAKQLLVASPYKLLQVQLNYMPGFKPDSVSLNRLVSFLDNIINKPHGIQIISTEIAPSGKTILALSDIIKIEKNNRTIFSGNEVIGVYILITDAGFTDAITFGKAYWNTSYAIFGKTIYDQTSSTSQLSRQRLLTTVLQHEFGHLLGLVSLGSPMQTPHKDGPFGTHCNNQQCLMYHNVETSAAASAPAIPQLDINCLADLKANGSK